MIRTIVFTDIEASTRMWEEHPVEMPDALEHHDSLLSESISEAGGTVLKTTGDGMIAVFDTAANAIAASLEAQRRLAASNWEQTGPIRVRIGIHTGDLESRSGDYFGPTMNRTARIMAAGHGNQILVSGSTAAAAHGALPDGVTLRDLGVHRLKDLTDPEHLFQLVHGDLATDFPALLTLDTTPNNLPQQPTEFLGRTEELAAIGLMLQSDATRLLTIAGPGGAGKTRLALQAAAEQLNNFRDGAFFVDLSSEREPDPAFEAVARELGLATGGGAEPLDLLKTRLRGREMLLVLDNLEQLMAAASGIGELVQACPHLKVLATSRETLRIRAEKVYPVPPLSLPDPHGDVTKVADSEAVQLFVERAHSVRPEFALSEENARAVAEICLRLDGLPLGIELAAARLNVFTPSELLARLEDRLDILAAGGRDLPDRQRTLWGAIGWSYELLNDDERAMVEMLSVFSSGRLPAIEAVSADALNIGLAIDALGSLVDKSLVRSEMDELGTRFTMLQMIREYAAAQLAKSPDREAAVRRAHADYFSRFVVGLREQLSGPEREDALQDLESEIGNLRTAWGYLVAVEDLERLFGLLDGLWALHQAKGWYRAAIELARDMLNLLSTAESSESLMAEELVLRTSLARALMAVRGYDIEVEEAFKEALAISEAGGTPAQRFPVLRALASFYVASANFEKALAIGERLRDLAEEAGDESILIEAHYVIGMTISFGNIDVSIPNLEKAIELYDPAKHGSTRYRIGPDTGVLARTSSAIIHWLCGNPAKARSRIEDALAIAREIDHAYSIAYALYHNGYVATLRQRFDDCLVYASELAEVARENEYEIWETLATVLEGVALTHSGSTEEGLAKTEAGIDLYQGLSTPPVFWPFLLHLRAGVHAAAGRTQRAIELIDEATELSREVGGAPPGMASLKADLLLTLPEPDVEEAERLYAGEVEVASQLHLNMAELMAMTRLVSLRRQLGIKPDGSERLAELYSSFEDGLEEHDLIAAAEVLGLR